MLLRLRSILIRKGIFRHYLPLRLPHRKEVILSMKRPVVLKEIEESLSSKINLTNENCIPKLSKPIIYLIEQKRRKDASNFFVSALRALYTHDPTVAIEFGLFHVFKKPGTSFLLEKRRLRHVRRPQQGYYMSLKSPERHFCRKKGACGT